MDIQQIYDLRARIVRGEPVSDEEIKAALPFLRQNRSSIAKATSTKAATTAKPKVAIDLSSLFGGKTDK